MPVISLGAFNKLKSTRHANGYIYVLQRSLDAAVKIGISRHPEKRFRQIRSHQENGHVFFYWADFVVCMFCAEKITHWFLGDCRLDAPPMIGGTEWFLASPDYAVGWVQKVLSDVQEFHG